MSTRSASKENLYSVINPNDDSQELQRKIIAARQHLQLLKKNQIVLARTRTVKRLLDNVRLSSSKNVTEHAPKEDLVIYAKELTNLRDSIDEKTRELAYSQNILTEKERILYEKRKRLKIELLFFFIFSLFQILSLKRCQLEELKLQAEHDFDHSQNHVAEHANRNSHLSLKLSKIQKAIAKMRIREVEIRKEIELKRTEIAEKKQISNTEREQKKQIFLLDKSGLEEQIAEAKTLLFQLTDQKEFSKWKASQQALREKLLEKKEAEDEFNDPLEEEKNRLQKIADELSQNIVISASSEEHSTIRRLESYKKKLSREVQKVNSSTKIDLENKNSVKGRMQERFRDMKIDNEDSDEDTTTV
ncbi:Oidioi.mRNA.OKI2018_I69.chr1.g1108.t1.cds [Oikopleura dioica]|uniref:Oidioi.mRNA.OKI2018_I69.chr1.g1108.t1.cds n=1 Tax=Oikopleura dioica TaxID=34765 RepID=A0ABN7SR65_OIKDI|nr:Oidioi.mRNA.OKI2018_I69.chr1.g1108.t1.cds [Oikopleura dioica]